MYKNILLPIAIIFLVFTNCSAALADTTKWWQSAPKQALGFIAGTVVGTPVCLIRKPIDEEKSSVEYLTGGKKDRRMVIPAVIFSLPFAVVSGVLEAPFSAAKHSWLNIDKPFSKEQFSLDSN